MLYLWQGSPKNSMGNLFRPLSYTLGEESSGFRGPGLRVLGLLDFFGLRAFEAKPLPRHRPKMVPTGGDQFRV